MIHAGDTTTEGDMSFVDEDFDSVPRCHPRRAMPGVLDTTVGLSQLNFTSMTAVDARTANIAVVNQGIDPGLAEHLMSAQQSALHGEANALHAELLERQRETLVSEARDHLTFVESNAAQQLSHKNLQLNEQAALAMSEMKSAHLHSESQEQRIKELNAELKQVKAAANQLNSSFLQAASDLNIANNIASNYKKQLDALTKQTMDMQKNSDLQRQDFERGIEKIRREQNDMMWQINSQSLGGTHRPDAAQASGSNLPPSHGQQLRSEYPDLSKISVVIGRDHTSDADDENEDVHPINPPGLRPGGDPPDGDDDDEDDSGGDDRRRSKKKKKDKKKKKSS